MKTKYFSVALAFGAKESSFVNNIFTVVNLGVVISVIISGLFKSKSHTQVVNMKLMHQTSVDSSNWSIPAEQIPEGFGNGGFAPYGFSGIIKGAATCFYGFIGFDCIATAGIINVKRHLHIV